jgi:hypothetical protein
MATRAFRRPVREEERARLLDLYGRAAATGGSRFEAGVKAGLRSILADRRFIYRSEEEPAELKPGEAYRLTDFDLASRLSFFLWSSLPDERLLDVALRGELRNPDVLERETRRMLQDPRAEALALNFGEMWLNVRWLRTVDQYRQTPVIEDSLRHDMLREMDLFFASIVGEDRSVVDLLDGNYTFLNERLARHYGILNIAGDAFRRVALDGSFDMRRGVLGKGAVLTYTARQDGMNIVLRGTWLLQLLGVEAPPPPPNVPPRKARMPGDPDPPTNRQIMEAEIRRSNVACVQCHSMIDPLGNALGNFTSDGQWQTTEWGKPIDAAVELVDGTKVNGPVELRNALVARSGQFARTFTERLMTYALGRGVDHRDMPVVRSIARDAARENNRFSAIVLGIVKSRTFQMNVKPAL